MRRTKAKKFVFPFLLAAVVLVFGCSSASKDVNTPRPVASSSQSGIVPVIVSSEVVVGPNRFTVGLIDKAQSKQVIGAQVRFRFFARQGQAATLKVEMDAKPVRITKSYTHTHQDGTTESHKAGETSVYIAELSFDAAGEWGLEVSGSFEGNALPVQRLTFAVRDKSISPAVGQAAPRTIQPIIKDVASITEIDTSEPPDPDMHNLTIADAVVSGKPSVIVFATPAFCTSQLCGPTKEIADDLYKKYRTQANFVHVEPYDLKKARSGQGLEPVPFLTNDWKLQSEPWVFVVDRKGKVSAKFEAIVTLEELETAVSAAITASG